MLVEQQFQVLIFVGEMVVKVKDEIRVEIIQQLKVVVYDVVIIIVDYEIIVFVVQVICFVYIVDVVIFFYLELYCLVYIVVYL